jgi:hypothetical protein
MYIFFILSICVVLNKTLEEGEGEKNVHMILLYICLTQNILDCEYIISFVSLINQALQRRF